MLQTIWMQGSWIGNLILQFLRNGGEFILLGIWGSLLTVLRLRFFRSVCREAALDGGEKGRMLRAMTLKFEKSYEVHVEISDREAFVWKYLCQEKRWGIPLPRWQYLPERWAGLILCVGAVEAAAADGLGYGTDLIWQRGIMALGTATAVFGLALLLDVDSLWEQVHVLLFDYVSNTLYPRQIHVYEGFEEAPDAGEKATNKETGKDRAAVVSQEAESLNEEEEKLFQEVLSDFLG